MSIQKSAIGQECGGNYLADARNEDIRRSVGQVKPPGIGPSIYGNVTETKILSRRGNVKVNDLIRPVLKMRNTLRAENKRETIDRYPIALQPIAMCQDPGLTVTHLIGD